jgi:hypothetical protein
MNRTYQRIPGLLDGGGTCCAVPRYAPAHSLDRRILTGTPWSRPRLYRRVSDKGQHIRRGWVDGLAKMTPPAMGSLGDRLPVVGDNVGEARAMVDSVYEFAAS